jgi:hypothetical protein
MEYRRCFLIRELVWRALVGALLTVVVLVTTVCNAITTVVGV